jgi:hypothetical protein
MSAKTTLFERTSRPLAWEVRHRAKGRRTFVESQSGRGESSMSMSMSMSIVDVDQRRLPFPTPMIVIQPVNAYDYSS